MSDTLHISGIQTALFWEDPQKNLAHLSKLLNQVDRRTHVVVLPEMFSTGFSMQPQKLAQTMSGSTVCWMQEQAKKHQMVITGSVIIEEQGAFFNRLLWVSPSGDIHQYNKRHLFSLAGEQKLYTAGKERLIIRYKGFKIMPLICYDLRFPVWSRNTESYDVLVYVANWPEIRARFWKSLLVARAIENMAYVVGVNRVGEDGNGYAHSGDSVVLDPLGDPIVQASAGGQEIIFATIEKEKIVANRKKFGFLNDADSFQING